MGMIRQENPALCLLVRDSACIASDNRPNRLGHRTEVHLPGDGVVKRSWNRSFERQAKTSAVVDVDVGVEVDAVPDVAGRPCRHR